MCWRNIRRKKSGKEEIVVKEQVLKALEGIKKEEIEKIVIAYEPIWAIGTGKTASSDDATICVDLLEELLEINMVKRLKKNSEFNMVEL